MREVLKTLAAVALFAGLMALLTAPARCADYVPDPDPPPVQVVKRLDAIDSRMDRIEKKLDAALAPKAVVPAQKAAVVTAAPAQRTFTGHTHTCRNGHTWDHTMDGGSHRCPTCGEFQNVVDSPGTASTYRRVMSEVYGSGCSGAGCNLSSGSAVTTRRGLFRR